MDISGSIEISLLITRPIGMCILFDLYHNVNFETVKVQIPNFS